MKIISLLKRIRKGQSLTRILMNDGFRDFILKGKVIDVGGGRNPDYFEYFKRGEEVSVEAVDGSINNIDFEQDRLPCADNSADTVICANVLEHIFNYRHLVSEMKRALKIKGQFIGFVPFLINYHPDPHDYFRYTNESLYKIFFEAGFTQIKIKAIGSSALYANYNNIMNVFPRFIRVMLFIPYYFLDRLYVYLRPNIKDRFPLGYIIYSIK
jgi:ubiquinone/menaquinone biosynthesis C-methylase UbiE